MVLNTVDQVLKENIDKKMSDKIIQITSTKIRDLMRCKIIHICT